MDDYKFLLKTISKDIDNKKDRKFIKENISNLSEDLYNFSSYFTSLMKISLSKNTNTDKIKLLKEIKYKDFNLNTKESNEVLKLIKQFGGADLINKKIEDNITTKLPEDSDIEPGMLDMFKSSPQVESTTQIESNTKNTEESTTQVEPSITKLEPSAPLLEEEGINNKDDTLDFLELMGNEGIDKNKILDNEEDDEIVTADDIISNLPDKQDDDIDNEGEFKVIDTIHESKSEDEIDYSQLEDGVYEDPSNNKVEENIIEPNKCRNRGFFECLINDNLLQDYKYRLDWIYLILFVLASVPFIGIIPNIIIIFRALRDGRTFLAIITSLTTALSLLEGHIIDLGLAFKIIYFLDVFTVVKYAKEYAPGFLNLNEPEKKGIIRTLLEKYGRMLSGFILFSLLTATEFTKALNNQFSEEDEYTIEIPVENKNKIEETVNNKESVENHTNENMNVDENQTDVNEEDEEIDEKENDKQLTSRPMSKGEVDEKVQEILTENEENKKKENKAIQEVKEEQKKHLDEKLNKKRNSKTKKI